MEKFEFSDAQAEHILLMRLQSLVGLELTKITDEIDEKQKLIAYLENIVHDPIALDGVVRDEMNYIKKTYGDDRKTSLVENES
jgi:DNA gyrase subunit A